MGATVVVLIAGMLLTGCLNTLLLKYQDQKCEDTPHGVNSGCASFPVLQSLMMFTGESLCFVVIGLMKLRTYLQESRHGRQEPLLVSPGSPAGYSIISSDDGMGSDDRDILTASTVKSNTKPTLKGIALLYLALPALCDICGTTTMSVGLLLVPASIFQMCRGSLVLFVGLFSVVFLGRRLFFHQWLSLFLVSLGVFIVGLSNVLGNKTDSAGDVAPAPDAKNGVLGIVLITGAQLFTASQFVIEEWVLSRYSIEPLRVAGLEGLFGTCLSILGIVVTYTAYGMKEVGRDGTFDVDAGLRTILGSASIWPAFLLFAFSIASFNFFGLSVTSTVSATSRSTIDTCRTLFIWAISMLLGWEQFRVLQLIGFAVLVYATLVFNGVIQPPRFVASHEREAGPVEVEGGLEHTLE